MERIVITIYPINEAFADYPRSEIGRILRNIAKVFEDGKAPDETLRDFKDNDCGSVQVD